MPLPSFSLYLQKMESIETSQNDITANLKNFLSTHLPHPRIQRSLPLRPLTPGQTFRPLLVRATAWDMDGYHLEAHRYFELFVEVHHVYTLIHDDLPCMDNDNTRRGKLTTHIQFEEWKALLTGNGLHALSYHLLSLIETPNLPLLLRYASWALGPKGLLLGQYLDLSHEMNKSFAQLILTHKLKTARLIQTSLVGSAIITEKSSEQTFQSLHRLGEHMGIVFQLLDDLCELTSPLSQHESQVNPFLTYPSMCKQQLIQRLENIESLLKDLHFAHTEAVTKNYFGKISTIINKGKSSIKNHIGETLEPLQRSSID